MPMQKPVSVKPADRVRIAHQLADETRKDLIKLGIIKNGKGQR